MPKTKVAGTSELHWSNVSDDELVGLDLQIDSPETLPGIVTEIPNDHEKAYIEFTYDLRGSEREEEFVCVHGHHRHLHGAVMRIGDVRFLVGWMCAKTIYKESLAGRIADYSAAVNRRSAIVRVKKLREAMVEFTNWASDVSQSGALEAYDDLRHGLQFNFPGIFESLNQFAGHRINNVIMPPNLCADGAEYIGASFGRLMNEIATVSILLTGDTQKVASKIGAIRSGAEGIIRRAEVVLRKLADVESFFQPATLAAVCAHTRNDPLKRWDKYDAGLLKISCHGLVLAMPSGFSMPSRVAIDHLQAALSG
jgi:hypothetical protein